MAEDRKLDRLFVGYDERNRNYPMRALLAADGPPAAFTYRHVQLDQGRQGACVCFGMATEAAARPVTVFGDPADPDLDVEAINRFAREWYAECKQRDGIPNLEGTYPQIGAQIGVERGLWGGYVWALGPGPERAADDLIRFVARGRGHGPAGIGMNWRSGMWRADADGWLRYEGSIEGGHYVALTAYSAKRDALFTPNSWGGQGQGWLSRADLVKALAEDGEGVGFVGRKMPRAHR